jgi:hypothetical protein
MKKFLVSIVAALMAAPAFAQYSSGGFELDKESMYYGVRFGGTIASVSGDVSVGSKVGMTLAGIIGLRVSGSTPVFLESGLYYTQRGAKDDDWEITSDNLEIPLVIKYGIKATEEIALLPFFGPYFAYAVSSDKKDKRSQADKDNHYKELQRINRNNMGFKLGCGAEYNKLYVELGYQFGVTNFLDSDDDTAHNNALFLNVGVNF